MTQEQYIQLKDNYVQFIKEMLLELGGLHPGITIMGTHKSDGLNAVVHIPIPPAFVNSEEGKEVFVEEVLPALAPKLRERFNIVAVAWSSEAWVRKMSKDDPTPDNWKDIPIDKEVIIISIERESDAETIVMEIMRNGKSVNEHGDLIDTIELMEMEELTNPDKTEGRFTGLYKKIVAN